MKKVPHIQVDANEMGELEVVVHIKGLRLWRFRFWMVFVLLKIMNLVAPKNLTISLCDCANAKEFINGEEQNS